MNAQALAYVFASYLLMHMFNRFLTAYVCDKPQTAEHALGLVPLLGIGFHSFLDGVPNPVFPVEEVLDPSAWYQYGTKTEIPRHQKSLTH